MEIWKIAGTASCLSALLLLSPARGHASPTVMLHSDRGVPWVTGGIGREEEDALLAESRDYDVKLVFALQGREFLSGVSVRILNEAGEEALAAEDAGPLFLAKLPSGSYRVVTTARGKTLTQSARVVEGRQAQLAFYWPPQVGDVAEHMVIQPIDTAPPRPTAPVADGTIVVRRVMPADPGEPRLPLRIERVWSESGTTYATLSVCNDAPYSLVKVSVECRALGRSETPLGPGRSQTILQPSEPPMLAGATRTVTIPVGHADAVRGVSCAARAL